MTETPTAPLEEEVAGESKEEKTARLNFFSDAVRAGLHSAGADIMEQMMAQGVPDATACILTGACQFIAELYEETANKTGADRQKFKAHMLESVGIYFDTYCEMTVKEALASAALPAGAGEKVQ